MVDLDNDPAWLVRVTLTTGVIAPTKQDAIDQVMETIRSEFGDDINMGEWGEMLPYDLENIEAHEVEDI